jgi:hypothetical protein
MRTLLRTLVRSLAAAPLLAVAAPSHALPKCEEALARLEGADKRVFAVERYGTGRYQARTGRGPLTYIVHAWEGKETSEGKENGATRILLFTEIPGTSRPNWGSASHPKELPARIEWRRLGGAELAERFRVYSGPLEGEWTLGCPGRPPIKVNFPRFADYPAGAPYTGPIAKLKMPRGLHEDLRLRLTDALTDDAKPEIAGRYIRLTWPCGSACVGGALMDAQSGRVIMLPTLSGWGEVADDFEPIDGRLNSRLVVLSGARNEKGIVGRHFYVLDNGLLKFLRSVEVEREFPQKVE